MNGLKAWRDLLLGEYRRREFSSYREYAKWLGVSHTTVSNALDVTKETPPGLEFLTAFHRKTGYGIEELLELVYPGMVTPHDLPLSARLLLQEFDQLPAAKQEIIRALIREWREAK